MKNLKCLFQQYSDKTPGCSVAVLKNNKLIFCESYGLADMKNSILNHPYTAFRLASITKTFTAMGVLILFEKGLLKLDDCINRYINDFPNYGKEITIRHLLSHTSGLPDHEKPLYAILRKNEEPTIQDALKILKKQTSSLFKSGTKYEYSDAGYVVLALIIELVSGTKYSVFLNKNIFQPLNMQNTIVVDETKPQINNRAFGYRKINNQYILYDYDPLNYIIGDEGIYSTVLDLAKWTRAWNSDILLEKKTLQTALTIQKLSNNKDGECGLGWFIRYENGKKYIFHDGFWVGFNNIMLTDFKSAITTIFLSNTNDFPCEEKKLEIANKIMNKIKKII